MIRDKNNFKYELGVMMYNVYNQSVKSDNQRHDRKDDPGEDLNQTRDIFFVFTDGYDVCGNFVGITNSLNIDVDDLKLGFMAEGLNHGKSNETLFSIFKEAQNLYFK